MAKVLTHWNVKVSTEETLKHGLDPMLIGTTKTNKPNIQHGFLMFENHSGCHAGINLSEVMAFSIEPEYKE